MVSPWVFEFKTVKELLKSNKMENREKDGTKLVLQDPVSHDLYDCLKELKFGRTMDDQENIQNFMDSLKADKLLNNEMKSKQRDIMTVEIITDLIIKYKPEIIQQYGGLSKFVDWIRSVDTKKLYKKRLR